MYPKAMPHNIWRSQTRQIMPTLAYLTRMEVNHQRAAVKEPKPDNLCKRSSVRLNTNIEAQLEASGMVNAALISNLSDTGLQIECRRRALEELMPNIQRPDPARPIQLRVRFTLQTDPPSELSLLCRMLYVRRLAQDRFLTGGEFVDISETITHQLQAYLRQQMRAGAR